MAKDRRSAGYAFGYFDASASGWSVTSIELAVGYSLGQLELIMVPGLQDGPSSLVYCRQLIH